MFGTSHVEMQQLANQLKSMFTNDGNVLLFNIHVVPGHAESVVFPATADELNGNGYGEKLYNMSSLLPLNYNEHILNVGNVEAVSIKDWVTKCYESLGKIPNFVNVYEEIEQRNYFSFYNYEYYLDVSRQSKIYPETISLEDGLRDSVKWYLEHRTEVNKKPYFEYINENLVES